jgi:hypothetical protein
MAAFHLKMDSRETANQICMCTSRNRAVLPLYDVLDMLSNLGWLINALRSENPGSAIKEPVKNDTAKIPTDARFR